MILTWFVFIPFLAGVLAWIAARWSKELCRWIALLFLMGELVLALYAWSTLNPNLTLGNSTGWYAQVKASWIPQLGIEFHLAMDGLSLLMVLLTLFLGIASIVCSWNQITEKVGFFHFCLMTTLCGIIGVFLSVDLFLFYVFWEAMLIPMYFLIAVWGYENRLYAAVKFLIFTQCGGLLMLAAILGLYFIHGSATGTYTFDYFQLLGTSLNPAAATWLMFGFFAAFAVKLPAFPLHSWLPDAHTAAPTAGSVILAGLLLKTGGYGFLRFVLPLFPETAATYAPFAITIGVIGIVYGAITAFGQNDLKRLVAYTSVSHLGFVLVGAFSGNQIAIQGAIVMMVAHGITTGALFIIVGLIQERIHTRDLSAMGGFWTAAPALGAVALVFVLASMGLPGLGNFVGDCLVLVGALKANWIIAVATATGLIFSVPYALRIMYHAFFGPLNKSRIQDLSLREGTLLVVMIAAILWLGLSPNSVINTASPTVKAIESVHKVALGNPSSEVATKGFTGGNYRVSDVGYILTVK
jgi:NADH-quinone oxidoreductase subunit M